MMKQLSFKQSHFKQTYKNKNIINRLILILIILTLLTQLTKSDFAILVPSVTPTYARSTSSAYSFSFQSASITIDFDIRILFQQTKLPLISPTNCIFSINDGAYIKTSNICKIVSNQLVFQNLTITQSITKYSIQFTSVGANYAGITQFTFRYMIPGTTTQISSLNSNYVQLTFTDASMTCTASSNNNVVGANGTVFTLSYTPDVSIPVGALMEIQVTPWGPFYKSNFITSNTTIICGGCSLSIPSSNGNLYQQLKYTNLYTTTGASASTVQQIVLNQARNPPSAQPISISMRLLISASGTQNSFMKCTTTLQVTSPNTMGLVTFQANNSTISAQNIITLQMQLKNPIAKTAYLRISTTLGLSFQYNLIFPTGIVPNQVTSGSNQLLLRNITAGTNDNRAYSLNNFTLTNPPYANKPVSITFTTLDFIDPDYFVIQTGSVSITSIPSIITQSNIQVLSSGINTQTTYTISFITINKLISNSFILLTVPTGMSTTGGSCNLISISSSCSIFNSTTFKAILNTAINSNTNISYQLTNFTNPKTTTQTESFIISTYYDTQQALVDYINSGITVTATSVALGSVILSSSSTTVGASSIYTVVIQNRNDLPSGSYLQITLPATAYTSSSMALNSFKVNNSPVATTCSMSSNGLILTFTSCVNSNIVAASQISIQISNIINPLSTKPTDSWIVQTFYNSKQMQLLTNGITIQMTVPANINFFKITPVTTTVNQVSSYKFQVTFAYKHYNNDRLQITLPSGISLNTGFSCSTPTTDYSVACFNNNAVTLDVRFSYNIVNYTNSLQFTITNVQNYWLASILTFNLKTRTNDTSTYYVQQGSGTVNYQPITLQVSIANNNKIVLTGQSQISVTINNPFVLNQASNTTKVSISMTVPNDITPNNGTCILSYATAVCSLTSTRIFTITSIGDFPNPLTITFKCQTQFFTQTANFDIKLKYDTSFIGSNTAATISSYCTAPCKQCGTSPTQCITCLQSPYTQNINLYPPNSSCVINCPSTYFLSTGVCQKCDTLTCLECSGTSTNCTACPLNRYLYNNACPSVCPNGFYASSTNRQCLSCQSPCAKCTSSVDCSTCVSNYFLDLDNRCRLICSNTSYLGIDGICQLCTNNCLSCSVSLSNCTSCQQPQYKLSVNKCVQTCQDFYYNSGNSTCQPCVQPCLTCNTATSCKSCIATYLLYNSTICTKICPAGTIPKANTICEPCATQCGTCDVIASNCTSCTSSLLFYQFQCLTQCPPLTYPYNKTCTTCIVPCLTCASSPQLCLSCTDNLLLLNQSCVSSCPATGYYKNGTTCVSCVNNCLQCENSISCNVCSNGFYVYQGQCVISCPSNAPIIQSRVCTACASQCSTCQTTPQSCITCSVYYYRYSYTCVQSCPLAYYSNSATFQCQDGLTSKIVFFPIFIIGIIIIVITIISKCFTPVTSFFTVLASLYGVLQVAIWIYVLALLFAPIKQPDIDYTLPMILTIVAIVLHFVLNIIFYFLNSNRLKQDRFVVQFVKNNVNYYVLNIFRFSSIPITHKWYRLCYSRLFNILALSVPYFNRSNVFSFATIWTILCLLVCQIPMIVASFSLIYTKLLKDQMFYTCIECLAVTILAALFALIDIYKSQEYFQENDYVKTKKYIDKIKDSSQNHLQDGFDIEKDQGSIDGQNFVGRTGGKLVYSKRDPSSLQQLFFAEDQSSQLTEAFDLGKKDSISLSKQIKQSPKKKMYRINIFKPVLEQQAEYYDQELIQDEQAITAAEKQQRKRKINSAASQEELDQENLLQQQKINSFTEQRKKATKAGRGGKYKNKAHMKKHIKGLNKFGKYYSIDADKPEKHGKMQQKQQLHQKGIMDSVYGQSLKKLQQQQGYNTIFSLGDSRFKQEQEINDFTQQDDQQQSDNKSLLEYRERKQHWNSIIARRKQIAEKIFGKTPLQKIQEKNPIYDQQQDDINMFGVTGQNMNIKRKRRNKKNKKDGKHNKQLQQIYLQRLTEMKNKKSTKNIIVSNKALKYQF